MQQRTFPFTYASQFAILLGLLGGGMIVGNLLVLSIGSILMHLPMNQVPKALTQPGHLQTTRFLNTLASFLVFCTPALILAKVIDKKPMQWLGFNRVMLPKQLLLVILIGFTGLILSGALGELNQNIPLPAKWLAKAKELEASYKQSMLAMVVMKNGWDYFFALLALAAAPAFFEEILFRAGFQQIFIGWTKHAFVGILLTSILFSAIHFSFFGFLPRTALGLILGYVFYYSRNIWMNIAMHFIYNGIIVTQIYIAGLKGKSAEKTMDENMPLWLGLVAIAAILLLLQMFRKESALALSLVSTNTKTSHATMEENI
jgi:membrane protease YdiL (CAAX protease family)